MRRIADRKEGRLITNEAQCSAAIGNRACPALAMKKEEKQAGHAIYYVNRIKMRQNQEENAELIGLKLGKRLDCDSKLRNPKPRFVSPQEAEQANIPQGIPHAPEFKSAPTIADAINRKIRELAKDEAIDHSSVTDTSTSKDDGVSLSSELVTGDLLKSKTENKPKSQTTAPINTKGLSLLEIARLRKQQATA